MRLAATQSASRKPLRSSSFIKIILGISFALVTLCIVYSIKIIQSHLLNDAANYQATFHAPKENSNGETASNSRGGIRKNKNKVHTKQNMKDVVVQNKSKVTIEDAKKKEQLTNNHKTSSKITDHPQIPVDGAKKEGEHTINKSTDHPHVYKWQDLKQRHQKAHGTFFFGPDSHQITIPEEAKYEPQL